MAHRFIIIHFLTCCILLSCNNEGLIETGENNQTDATPVDEAKVFPTEYFVSTFYFKRDGVGQEEIDPHMLMMNLTFKGDFLDSVVFSYEGSHRRIGSYQIDNVSATLKIDSAQQITAEALTDGITLDNVLTTVSWDSGLDNETGHGQKEIEVSLNIKLTDNGKSSVIINYEDINISLSDIVTKEEDAQFDKIYPAIVENYLYAYAVIVVNKTADILTCKTMNSHVLYDSFEIPVSEECTIISGNLSNGYMVNEVVIYGNDGVSYSFTVTNNELDGLSAEKTDNYKLVPFMGNLVIDCKTTIRYQITEDILRARHY